jgi:hypothetical protein
MLLIITTSSQLIVMKASSTNAMFVASNNIYACLLPCHNQSYHPNVFGKVFHLSQRLQRIHILIFNHGTSMNKKVQDHNKLNIFMFLFNGAIIQKLVKDRRLVMNSICLLSLCMHWILIIIVRTCFNFKHWDFAFSMLNMFQQSIQLWNDECFSHSHMGANLALNLMH